MKTMYTYLYMKRSETIPMEINHLYEHLVVQSFYEYLTNEFGIHPGAVGYVGGETFRNIIFIEAWFYDPYIADLFAEFMNTDNTVAEFISVCIQQCEAESREEWQISNDVLLRRQLKALRDTQWTNSLEAKPFLYVGDSTKDDSSITIHKSASSFKSVTISPYYNLDELSFDDRVLFLRLNVIIKDIVMGYIRQKGWYAYDTHIPVEKGTHLFAPLGVGLPAGSQTNRSIEHQVSELIRTFDVKKQFRYLQAHFNAFAHQPTWIGRVRESLPYVDTVATNRAIASLASEKNIANLMQKIDVRVETVPHKFATSLAY